MDIKYSFFGKSIRFPSDILAADLSVLLFILSAVFLLTKYKKWKWLWGWVTTTHHSKIGILYLTAGGAFFLRGGLDALIMRLQLALPENHFWVFQGEKYNQMMTTHGTTMIFFVAMPLLIGLMNIAVPLQIGARDLAFPYMNALSFWLFFAGGSLVNISFVLGGSPSAGWTAYAPLALSTFSPGPGNDYYALGLQIAGIGTLLTAINFLVTILNKRTPGMKLSRMPLFTWSTLVTAMLILFAFPALTVALLLLTFDRMFGTAFLVGDIGNSLIWQHLFWIFGHPEVYILILPAFGIFSDVITVFSKKQLFGYTSMVFAIVLIGFLGFMVWVHHMFTVGLGPSSNAIFAISTMSIAVPTGIKVFNWLFTLRGGVIRFTTAMLYALAFIPTFVMGGVTGVMLAAAPADYQYHDSYFVVGHFHYVLVGGTILGIFSGIYYWWPKMFGFLLDEKRGKWQFWLFTVGFHLTFFPMHIMGLMGMPRRVYTYLDGEGLGPLNMISTIGAFLMGFSVLLLLYNIYWSYRHGEKDETGDPWNGRTLEWSIPSPPPEYNFARRPFVRGVDAFWKEKMEGDGAFKPAEGRKAVHIPSSTAQPMILSGLFFLTAFGFIFDWRVVQIGGGISIVALAIIRSFTDCGGRIIHPEEMELNAVKEEE
ncbi:cytochrome c oxidase subunit I [Falsibacillus albus]|uniref:Cytochrome c oxidase subunit 1 n=1 Tax=Falsibacillus albus TaxID=2478915 RepID=A0A3L7K303_9BACI|nr:cytochrome c oxidase subunit I [Falsibacillus albus]RLQ96729.1 cytochrome ubiquinol oxidase subunit I [Falsibacillus albus]